MMKRRIIYGLLMVLPILGYGQSVSQILYTPDTIYVGDVVELSYRIDTEGKSLENMTMSFQKIKNIRYDTLIEGSVEYMDIEPTGGQGIKADPEMAYIAPEAIKDGILKIRVGVFDAGVFMPPRIQASVDGRIVNLPMQQIGIPVYMRAMKTETPDVGDIRDIILEEKNWRDYLWILWTVLGLLAIGLLGYFLSRKKPDEPHQIEGPEEVIPQIAEDIEALEALEQLKASGMWKDGREKAYHSELTYIVRRYLSRRYDISALEMTSDEVMDVLKKKALATSHTTGLSEILRIADIVKFAKGEASDTLNERFLEDAIDLIQKTKRKDV